MANKVCLITGGNSGIGKAASIKFLLNGDSVIITSRSVERGENAIVEIKEKSNKNDIQLLLLDLSLQSSIKNFVEKIKNYNIKIDVLINNAAEFDVSKTKPEITSENIEKIWATNFLGPKYLIELFVDNFLFNNNAKVINISSKGLLLKPFLSLNITDPEFRVKGFSVSKSYYHSKKALEIYTAYISEQSKYSAINFSVIRVTNVKIDINRYPHISKFFKFLYLIKSKFSILPDKMAETYLFVSNLKSSTATNGLLFYNNNKFEYLSKAYFNSDFEKLKMLLNRYPFLY